MTANDKKLSITEVRGRLFELIFNMPEAETRDLLKKMEIRWLPKYEERRKHPRESTFVHVDCSGNQCAFTDFIQNLSAGGLYIDTQLPFFPGQELSMTFSVTNGETPIKITGKIVRVDSRGIGVKFDALLSDL
ncbi:MAG: PilZ domain-containing protein [Deltaproteobacteria bacterium]|jgi:hypothetical protein|nr:PilZ domain-containing protein [Deltaproteobacteria bacterium]MBW1747739.1 PilZ domain-containing protein [Deltaproteobacteria bacterium]MBW1826798.1 PilZ domain-containing protein [Deltaproteobacteria bacterium]MBW1969766.1 PilZ domain-containing protein [Deltaproteobacteria bacterium]MBW2157175.1 PilZ domain-containing protein [Deltaproteobacteria bacterium]